MERRSSYSRSICALTVAARIAEARNKRETLLLAEARKGLFSQTNRTIRTFYREKAKAKNFLQKVRRRSYGTLIAKNDEHGKVVADKKISFTRTGNAMIDQKPRCQSLDVYQTDEIQKRIQKFLARSFPGRQSTNEQVGHLKGENNKDELAQLKNLDLPGPERFEDGSKTIDTSTLIPFKVRSRTSGICFSHSHCQHLHLPPINLPDIGRKCSAAEFRRNSFCNFSKRRCRKLSTPSVAGHLSLERHKLLTSMPLINSPREAINETSRGAQRTS